MDKNVDLVNYNHLPVTFLYVYKNNVSLSLSTHDTGPITLFAILSLYIILIFVYCVFNLA